MEPELGDLVGSLSRGRLSRRAFVVRASALGLSTTAISSLLAACAGDDKSASGDVSGNLVLYKGPFSATEPKQVGELIASFQAAYPKARVKREQFDWEAMDAQFPTRFLSNSPPDVSTVPDLVFGQWAERGVFEDLTPYVTDSSWANEHDAIPDEFWQIATNADGKIYGVPWWGVVLSMLYVNRDLLEQAGVTDVNSSVEAFHEAARKVRALGDKTYGFSIHTTQFNPAAFDWAAWLHASGASLLNDDWTACAANTPAAQESLQLLADMQAKEKLSPAPGAYDQNGLRDLFRSGRVGMHHDDNGFVNALRTDPPAFEFDVAAIPGGPPTGIWGIGLLAIHAKSENKEAAWALIKHLSSADVVSTYFEQVALLPNRTDLADRMFQNDPYTQKVQREILPEVKGWQLHPKLAEMLGRAQPSFDALYAGDKSAADALAEACKAIDGVL